MKTVIRNNEYLFVDEVLIDDIEVSIRPHPNAQFINGEWALDIDSYISETDKKEAEEFLNNTDWKVTRHKEQCDLGIVTSLTEEEYLALITERQKRREILNGIIN